MIDIYKDKRLAFILINDLKKNNKKTPHSESMMHTTEVILSL